MIAALILPVIAGVWGLAVLVDWFSGGRVGR